jgi:hypothetical protein
VQVLAPVRGRLCALPRNVDTCGAPRARGKAEGSVTAAGAWRATDGFASPELDALHAVGKGERFQVDVDRGDRFEVDDVGTGCGILKLNLVLSGRKWSRRAPTPCAARRLHCYPQDVMVSQFTAVLWVASNWQESAPGPASSEF